MWPAFRLDMLCFAALGAFALWMRLKYGASIVRDIEQFVNELADDFKLRMIIQLLIFVGLGALISVIMVDPNTERQALAAGMAWTALLGSMAATARKGKAGGGSA